MPKDRVIGDYRNVPKALVEALDMMIPFLSENDKGAFLIIAAHPDEQGKAKIHISRAGTNLEGYRKMLIEAGIALDNGSTTNSSDARR